MLRIMSFGNELWYAKNRPAHGTTEQPWWLCSCVSCITRIY